MRVDFNFVPNGWKKVKIAKKLFFQEGPGVRKWQFTTEGIKLLNVGNINEGKVDLSTTDKHLSIEEATGKYAHFLVEEGDLLIACSGIVVDNFHNKIAFAKKEHLPLCLNTSTMRFRPLQNDVDLNYFKYFLQTAHFTSQLQKLITGSAQLNFGPSHIKKIDFLLPPLTTQKRIAQILDNAAALRDKTQQLLTEYDQLAQSIFLEMFGDSYHNPKKFDLVNLNYFIKQLETGKSVNSTNDKYEIGEIGILKTSCVYRGVFDISEAKVIREDELDKAKLNPKKDSIIISRMNTEELVGKSAYVDKDYKNLFLPDRLWQSIKSDVDHSVLWLSHAISQNSFMKSVSRVSTGTSGSMKNISQKKFLGLKIINPPIHLQNQFAEKIALIEHQKALAKQELEQSEDLFNCLLQKAFKGELV